MRINVNVASLNVYRNYTDSLDKQSDALSKISSGLKVQNSKDNPVKLAASEKVRMQIRTNEMVARNAQDGISLLQVGEGGLSSISDSMQRLKELLVSCDGTKTSEDMKAVQAEVDSILTHIDVTAHTTEMNGVKIIGDELNLRMRTGATGDEFIHINTENMDVDTLGLSQLRSSQGGIVAGDNAIKSITKVDDAIKKVNEYRSKFGALQNRLESCYNDTIKITDTLESADSDLRDVDIAEEMANYVTQDILVQAGFALMAQTNKFPQDVLQILQNVRSR